MVTRIYNENRIEVVPGLSPEMPTCLLAMGRRFGGNHEETCALVYVAEGFKIYRLQELGRWEELLFYTYRFIVEFSCPFRCVINLYLELSLYGMCV